MMNLIILISSLLLFSTFKFSSASTDPSEPNDPCMNFFEGGEIDFLIDPHMGLWEDIDGVGTATATAAAVAPPEHEESIHIELASPELQYIGNNLLAFHLEDLAEILNRMDPKEIKKSIKVSCNWNLLHEAVYTDNVEVAEFLILHYGFDPNKFDPYFGNCVYLVRSVRMVNLLMSNGTDFSIRKSCYLYRDPFASAMARNNASLHAAFDLSNLNYRVSVFLNKLRSAQTSGSVKKFNSTRDKMYQHALNVVSGFTKTRNPNAKIKVNYTDQSGIDLGGLTVDFISFIKNEIIKEDKTFEKDPDTGLLNFKEKSPMAEARLIGFIVGLSIYHQVPLNMVFSPIIYHLICAKNPHRDINFVSVLAEGHPTIYKSFENLKKCSKEMLKDVEQTELRGDNLRPWKRRKTSISDKEDLVDYIKTSAKYIVFDTRFAAYNEFLTGLGQAIDHSGISDDLNPEDVKLMIKGQVDYTAADLAEYAILTNPEAFQQIYDWFFKVVDEITEIQRAKLLKFFTSLDCVPISGFKDLDEPIKIDMLTNCESPDEKLPEAATCFNRIKLHLYSSKEILKTKLLKAIEEGVGFFIA